MSTLLLTNRFGTKENFWISTPMLFFYPFAIVFFIAFSIKSCNQKIKDQDIPDVAYKARAIWKVENGSSFLIYDTAKKPSPPLQTKIVNHNYVLQGNDTLFNILWLQINSPIDVTPRQLNALKDWMQRGLKQDTTIKK